MKLVRESSSMEWIAIGLTVALTLLPLVPYALSP